MTRTPLGYYVVSFSDYNNTIVTVHKQIVTGYSSVSQIQTIVYTKPIHNTTDFFFLFFKVLKRYSVE